MIAPRLLFRSFSLLKFFLFWNLVFDSEGVELGAMKLKLDSVLIFVIGKRGKNIGAIRTLISAATAKEGGKRSIIEIIE